MLWSVPQHFLIFKEDLLIPFKGEGNELIAIQADSMKSNSGDLVVFISGVVVDSSVRITAGAVAREFVFAVFQLGQSLWLTNCI